MSPEPGRVDLRKTFREVYCAQFDIPIERYENHILKQCLFARARVLKHVLELFSRRAFAVDRAFLNGFGQARTAAELNSGLDDFIYDPHNRRWVRRELKLRISTRKFLELAKEVMPELSIHNAQRQVTRAPFAPHAN